MDPILFRISFSSTTENPTSSNHTRWKTIIFVPFVVVVVVVLSSHKGGCRWASRMVKPAPRSSQLLYGLRRMLGLQPIMF